MASLTVRQLDEKVKKLLRLRAARAGRSMEDEIRTILGQAALGQTAQASGREAPEPLNPPAPVAHRPLVARAIDATPQEGRRRVLLVIGGGIAAYKSLDLIRRLHDHGATVRCILTKAAQEFVTPLAAGALAGGQVFTDLFDPKSEFDVGHVRLARDTELIVVAPATADLMAKMAGGHADDLASAVLLATDTFAHGYARAAEDGDLVGVVEGFVVGRNRLELRLGRELALGLAERGALRMRDLAPAHLLVLTHLQDRADVLVGDAAGHAFGERQGVVDLAVAELLIAERGDLALIDAELRSQLVLWVRGVTVVIEVVIGALVVGIVERVLPDFVAVVQLGIRDRGRAEREREHQTKTDICPGHGVPPAVPP